MGTPAGNEKSRKKKIIITVSLISTWALYGIAGVLIVVNGLTW